MRFAFMILGNFDAQRDRAMIHDGAAQIIGVPNLDEACSVARELCSAGVGCIELCGGFEEAGAKRVVEATQNKIPIGYVTSLPEQAEICRAVFGK